MLNEVPPDVSVPERSPERTMQPFAHDYQHLLAQLRRLLSSFLEQMRAAPAPSPQAALGELLWPVPVHPAGASPIASYNLSMWTISRLPAQTSPQHC